MGFYDAFKDAIAVAQKADNIELYRQLLDLSAMALDMQNEISELKSEVIELRRARDLENRIIHHKTKKAPSEYSPEYPYITLNGDTENIRYCAICWGKNRQLIPLYDELNCVACHPF